MWMFQMTNVLSKLQWLTDKKLMIAHGTEDSEYNYSHVLFQQGFEIILFSPLNISPNWGI